MRKPHPDRIASAASAASAFGTLRMNPTNRGSSTTPSPKSMQAMQPVQKSISRTNSRVGLDHPHRLAPMQTAPQADTEPVQPMQDATKPMQRPPDEFLDFVASFRTQPGPHGNLARAIRRDPCFPKPSRTYGWNGGIYSSATGTFLYDSNEHDPDTGRSDGSYAGCVNHINEVHHGKADTLKALADLFKQWKEAWWSLPGGDYPYRRFSGPRFPPRQDIFAAAAESGLRVSSNGMAFCWNDVPGSPTQGHFNGNRVPSMRLYTENDTFFCHQCGIWGFSDQLKTRTWQGQRK